MSNKLILVFCLLFALTAATSKTQGKYRTHWGPREAPRNPQSPRIYDINLDLSYEDRWRHVIADHKQEIDRLLEHLWIKSLPMGLIDKIMYPLAHRYHPAFAEEVQALANLVDNSFTKLLILNFLYDLGAACSSILVQDVDDNVIHARTLDFGITPYIANLTFHGKYYRDGKLLYEAIDIAGYTGVITGYKPGAYSFSINEYFVESEVFFLRHIKLVTTYLKQIYQGYLTPPYVVRKAFEQAEDYDSFVKILCDTETVSRVHYIVAGAEKGQGAVITKFQDKVQNITKLDAAHGRWFIAQTNYERDVPDPEKDNRRTAEIDRLEAIGKEKITIENLFTDVMDVYPTFNAHTVHTTIMEPSKDYCNTTIWCF